MIHSALEIPPLLSNEDKIFPGRELLIEVILIVLLGDRLKGDPVKRIDLLAFSEFRSDFHGNLPLSLGILEDRHCQVAPLHLTERIPSGIDAGNERLLRIA